MRRNDVFLRLCLAAGAYLSRYAIKATFCLFASSLLWNCRPITPDPDATINSSTDSEIFEASAPTSSTLIKSMIVQKTINGVASPGEYRYEYQYSYDNASRLVKLDYWGYLYKQDQGSSGVSYGNFVHRVAVLTYNATGELSALSMTSLDPKGQSTPYSLTFPVVKVGTDLVIYSQPSPYSVSPFLNQPILRISATGRLVQSPLPWNDQPNTQFALNAFDYDASGNLKSITLAHLDDNLTLQQTPVLSRIDHATIVNNPFAQHSAYAAAHFLARGGFWTSSVLNWPDVSQKMVLFEQMDLWSMQESRPVFTQGGNEQTYYVYHYNGNSTLR